MGTTYLIVGIDPGIKVGYAAIDLNGELVGAGCTKQKSHDKIIELIQEIGIPSLIATDVHPAPAFVKKISASIGSKLYVPRKSISKEKKRMIGKHIFNPHIRDAYAATIKAYRSYANRFRRIEKKYPNNAEKYKHLILKGVAVGKISI